MTAAILLWLGLYGLVLFMSYDAPMCRRDARWWAIGSAAVATLLCVPIFMIILSLQLVLLG